MRLRWGRPGLVWALLLALACAASGCKCGRESDEEILKKRIDTTSVHLYLATKVAILRADTSPEVRAAREQLFIILDLLSQDAQAGAATGTKLSATDLLKLTKALWSLRSQGQELLRNGREAEFDPILPILLRDVPELAALIDQNTEHTLLLTAFFLLKTHPKSPTPIPDEILLYEAWMIDAGALKLEGLSGLARAVKAWVYGTNELCDLAAAEGAGLDRTEQKRMSGGGMSSTVAKLTGSDPHFSDESAKTTEGSLRALAHGQTAACYLQREEQEKAVEELDKFVQALEDAGVPPGETALVRAYIAHERGDRAAVRARLEEARDYPGTDADTRRDVEELLTALDKQDDGKFSEYFSQAHFALFTVKVTLRGLERAGVFRDVQDTRLVQTVQGYATAAGRMLSVAETSFPSLDSAKEKASSWRCWLGTCTDE